MSTSELFLPFTPVGAETEHTAVRVKKILGFGPYYSVDPWKVLARVPARVLTAADFATCTERTRAIFCGSANDKISAAAYMKSPATGEWLIYVNGAQARHRQKASLMEEIVHIVLDHPKTVIAADGVQIGRTFDKAVEEEAFNVGAACIIPYRDLFFSIKKNKQLVGQIAARYDVSNELVVFRIKRAGLTKIYKKECGPLTND